LLDETGWRLCLRTPRCDSSLSLVPKCEVPLKPRARRSQVGSITGNPFSVSTRSGPVQDTDSLRICGQTRICGQRIRGFVVKGFMVRRKDLWSDGTGTLLRVVNRPPFFRSSIEARTRKKIVTDRRQREPILTRSRLSFL
jgi:hypothetical protein